MQGLGWDQLTEGQKRLASYRETGEYSGLAFGALVGIPIGVALVWITDGDWLQLNSIVWIFAISALLGHLKSTPSAVLAARYQNWLENYEREMRKIGRYDRGEPSEEY